MFSKQRPKFLYLYEPLSFREKSTTKYKTKEKKSIFHKCNNKDKSLGSKIRKAPQRLCYANTNI